MQVAVVSTTSDQEYTLGCYRETSDRQIVIDLCHRAHRSARQVQATLLHELCHAAAGPGHGVVFFREVERLLVEDAPIYVDFGFYANEPEMAQVLDELPECRRMREHQERRRRMREWARRRLLLGGLLDDRLPDAAGDDQGDER